MKHHAHLIIYSTCISAIILLCACRSSYRHNNQFRESKSLQSSNSDLYTSTGTITSQVKTKQEENGKRWKITYHFDNTLPTDPITGLSPVSGIEIEGSENQIKTTQESNDSTQTDVSSSTTDSLNLNANKESNTNTDTNNTVATGTDDGIRNGLTIGIPLCIIIIALSYYAKRQNTSK